jgi:hypothetical protein
MNPATFFPSSMIGSDQFYSAIQDVTVVPSQLCNRFFGFARI